MPQTPPMVLVVWEDAYALDVGETWVLTKPTVWEPCLVHSVGFLIYEGPEGVVLAESWRHDFTGQRQQLPRGLVRSVQRLNPTKGSRGSTAP